MTKKIIKAISLLITAFFLFIFFLGNTVYKQQLTEKKDLTEEQIMKFEEDIKNGVEIDMNDYVVKEKNYNNRITEINKDISSVINYGFKKLFEYFLKNINI